MTISMIPSQKIGIAWPSSAKTIPTRSINVFDLTEEMIPTGTAKFNYHGVLDAAAAECPTVSDFAAIGVKGVKGPIGIAARLDTFDMWACVLCQEPDLERRVCIDGLVTLVP